MPQNKRHNKLPEAGNQKQEPKPVYVLLTNGETHSGQAIGPVLVLGTVLESKDVHNWVETRVGRGGFMHVDIKQADPTLDHMKSGFSMDLGTQRGFMVSVIPANATEKVKPVAMFCRASEIFKNKRKATRAHRAAIKAYEKNSKRPLPHLGHALSLRVQ